MQYKEELKKLIREIDAAEGDAEYEKKMFENMPRIIELARVL